MFEQSLVESTAMLRTRSRKPVYTAIAIQAAVAAALLSIPILHPEVLPLRAPQMTLTAPPLPHPQPPPPRVRVENTSLSSAPTAPTYVEQTSAPGHLFPTFNGQVSEEAPSIGPITMSAGGPGIPIGIGSSGSSSSVSVRSIPAARKDPLSISTGVMAGRLLVPIMPVYPNIAKITHTEGIVVIEAVISTTGRIESARAVSGPAILQAAALEAVRNARYRPYLLNGAPTEVQTTITVNFRMGG